MAGAFARPWFLFFAPSTFYLWCLPLVDATSFSGRLFMLPRRVRLVLLGGMNILRLRHERVRRLRRPPRRLWA